MAHTYSLGKARTNSSANPITVSYTVNAGDTVVCLMIKTVGSTNRAGGAPTFSGGDPSLGTATFLQAGSTQKAASSPEASAEIWYCLNPLPGTYTLTIPNTGAKSIFYTVGIGRAASGGSSIFGGTNGSNATSTNPTSGAINYDPGAIGFAIVATGATTWNPSARTGTKIADTDDGADGGGEQYSIRTISGNFTLSWTFGTSDDWGACAAAFFEVSPTKNNNFIGGHSSADVASVGRG